MMSVNRKNVIVLAALVAAAMGLTKTQAAKYLQMGEDKLVRLLRCREIRKARRWGARNEWRVPLDALDEWLERESVLETARPRPVPLPLDDRRAS